MSSPQLTRRAACLLILAAPALAWASMPNESGLTLELSFPETVRSQPFTGRVLVFVTDRIGEGAPPPRNREFMSRQPVFFVEAKDWKPGMPLPIERAEGYPCDMAHLEPGKYRIQAVMHVNPDLPHSGTAAGNLFSKAKRLTIPRDSREALKLVLDQTQQDESVPDVFPGARSVELRSELLSKFYGRDIMMRAIVLPPDGYTAGGTDRFPAIYAIPGFGSDAVQAAAMARMMGGSEVPFVRIGLDPTCGWGHHVFADSANNGPRGRALVEEMIPYLEKQFRLMAEPRGRFLTGHSSGGWSSLWLQVAYPDFFGGVWSGSPDPVDFHNFTGINLYDPKANFLYLPDGTPRPIMRHRGRILMNLCDLVAMEAAVGPGGQVQAFEAVFSPRGDDGKPLPVFDRKTGVINHDVVEAWKAYDIREKLEKEWATLGPKLEGKITIIVGAEDNFYLDEAVRLLEDSLKSLGSDARIIIVPKADHSSVIFTPPYRKMIHEMSEKYRRSCDGATTRKAEPTSPVAEPAGVP